MVEKEEWQCPVCGLITVAPEAPKVCPDCNAPGALHRNVTNDTRDEVDPKSVEHHKKKLTQCLNYKVEPGTNRKIYHKLELEEIVNKDHVIEDAVEKSYVTIITRCKPCKMVYGVRRIPTSRTDILEKLHISVEGIHA